MPSYYFVTCSCGQQMRVGDEHFGKTGKCVKCRKPITITRDSVTPIDAALSAAPAARATRPAAGDGVPAEWNPGDVILDLYEVIGVLGQGGMGKVYRVHHKGWNVDLAVKSPLPDSFQTHAQKDNFVRECETWVNLGLHPHTVSCYYVRTLGGIPRVFAEYIEGGTLEQWITSGKLYEGGKEKAVERILDIAIQFAWGLHYAHEQGLIHQDVKPANVMMAPDGVTKVTDFGLVNARAVAGADVSAKTGSRSIMASYGGMTPAYCSPEQAGNAARHQAGMPREQLTKLTRQTDIYSWAVSVFEMFNGGVSWLGGNVVGESLKQYVEAGPSEEHLPSMPESVAQLLTQCLTMDVAARPKEFLQIADRLKTSYCQVKGVEYNRQTPKPADALADTLNNHAISLMDLGEHEKAEELWGRALAEDVYHLESAYNLGLVRWRAGHSCVESILKSVREAGRSAPEAWRTALLSARVLLESDDCKSAIEVLEKLTDIDAEQGEIRAALAYLQERIPKSRRLLRIFEGHTGAVTSVSLSSDARQVLSGSSDKTLRLWDVSTGSCLRTFEGHTDTVISVCLGVDGRYALSGSGDTTLKLWEITTGHCLRSFKGHEWSVQSVCLSADCQYALSGSNDKTLKLWDVATGRCLRTFLGHTLRVTDVCLSADGRYVLSGSDDKTLKLWDIATSKCLHTFEGHTDDVDAVCLSRDGRYALSGGGDFDKTIKLWEIATDRCLGVLVGHAKGVNSACLTPNGQHCLSGGADGTLKLWEMATGRCLRTFGGHANAVNCVRLSGDGHYALSGGCDKSLRLWQVDCDVANWIAPYELSQLLTSAQAISVESEFRGLLEQSRLSRSAGNLHTAARLLRQARLVPGYSRHSETVRHWRDLCMALPRIGLLDAWEERAFKGHAGPVFSACLSKDGRYALSGGGFWDHTLKLWEVATGRCIRTLEGHTGSVEAVCLSDDCQYALSYGKSGGNIVDMIKLWDVATGQCLRTFPGQTVLLSSVCLSADGRYALSGSEYCIGLWEVATGRCLRTFGESEEHRNFILSTLLNTPDEQTLRAMSERRSSVTSLCLTEDGRYALSGNDDQSIKLWEVATGRCLRTFQGHKGTVRSVCLSVDGQYALSGSNDKTLKLWEVSSGQCLRTFNGHTDAVKSVCLSGDSRYALSGGWDRSLRLWEVGTGLCLRTFEEHTDLVWPVSLSGDGHYALSGSHDHTLKLWALDWELGDRESSDWDECARTYLQMFLTSHMPYATSLSQDRAPTHEEVTLALTRRGKPTWTDEDFKQLLYTLGCAGFGWLRPEGVRKELDEMAATWDGPPPLL